MQLYGNHICNCVFCILNVRRPSWKWTKCLRAHRNVHTPAEYELPKALALQAESLSPLQMSLDYRKNPQHKFNAATRITEVAAKLSSSRLQAIGVNMLLTMKLCNVVKGPATYAPLFYVQLTPILSRSLQPILFKRFLFNKIKQLKREPFKWLLQTMQQVRPLLAPLEVNWKSVTST